MEINYSSHELLAQKFREDTEMLAERMLDSLDERSQALKVITEQQEKMTQLLALLIRKPKGL